MQQIRINDVINCRILAKTILNVHLLTASQNSQISRKTHIPNIQCTMNDANSYV